MVIVSPDDWGVLCHISDSVHTERSVQGVRTHTAADEQRAADDTFAHTALEIVQASGPIGIGSAMNAIAIAVFVEAVMVLARMLSEQQRAQGRAEGIKEGIKEERKRSNAKLRALAKEYGIPEDKLPIEDEDE